MSDNDNNNNKTQDNQNDIDIVETEIDLDKMEAVYEETETNETTDTEDTEEPEEVDEVGRGIPDAPLTEELEEPEDTEETEIIEAEEESKEIAERDDLGALLAEEDSDEIEEPEEIIESDMSEEPVESEETEADLEIPEIELTQEMVDAGYFIPDEEKKRFAEEAFDWIEIFSSALLTVILLFTFIFRLVTVQGPSMEYTLHGGELAYGNSTQDNLIISNLFYTPKQGDIVVIQVPNSEYKTPIIKRVIAVENDRVYFDFENWIVYVNDKPIYEIEGKAAREPYVNYEEGRFMNGDNGMSLPTTPENAITIEKGKIFVMGDNRNHSSDSRDSRIGQVDIRDVVGRVLIRVFPFDKFGVVKTNEK